MLLARVGLHAAAFSTLCMLFAEGRWPALAGLEAVALGSLALARSGRFRPASDLAAWAGTAAVLALLPAPPLLSAPTAFLALGALVSSVVALHVPSGATPAPRRVRATASWAVAAAACLALGWLPGFLLDGRPVAVQEALSPAGAALRLLAGAALLALACIVWQAFRGAPSLGIPPSDKPGPPLRGSPRSPSFTNLTRRS